MKAEYVYYNDDGVDRLLDPYRSHFWLVEHQWFVRCDSSRKDGIMYLYTLPYAFTDLNVYPWSESKSTCPSNTVADSYDRVESLTYRTSSSVNAFLPDIQFSNIQRLHLKISFENWFWSIVPTLNRLISLEIHIYADSDLSPLQTLLDKAPRLYSLSFYWWCSSPTGVLSCNLTSASVRRIELGGYNFNSEQCVTLSQSSLGAQCEVLLVKVENRIDILDLFNSMTSLRALGVQCKDDEKRVSRDDPTSSTHDELVEWLRDRLPPNCTMARDPCLDYRIQIWISSRHLKKNQFFQNSLFKRTYYSNMQTQTKSLVSILDRYS
jgi:hypothetical protein